MKKLLVNLSVIVMCLLCCVSFVGCAFNKEGKTTKTAQNQSSCIAEYDAIEYYYKVLNNSISKASIIIEHTHADYYGATHSPSYYDRYKYVMSVEDNSTKVETYAHNNLVNYQEVVTIGQASYIKNYSLTSKTIIETYSAVTKIPYYFNLNHFLVQYQNFDLLNRIWIDNGISEKNLLSDLQLLDYNDEQILIFNMKAGTSTKEEKKNGLIEYRLKIVDGLFNTLTIESQTIDGEDTFYVGNEYKYSYSNENLITFDTTGYTM